jgi:lipopolysaccharide biosynthesis protein
MTAWKTVVRPNYGYDFGGYRDGLLSLGDWRVVPERLLILNDSIWFPICSSDTLIDRLEALETDIGGAVIHPAMQRQRFSTKRRAFHKSYYYLLNKTALFHPAFDQYWRKFRVSSNKYNAVYRGERGFSHAIERAGLRLRGVLSPDALFDAVAAADDDVLRKTLTYAAYTDPDFIAENGTLLASAMSRNWRADTFDHIRRVITRRSFHASFPYATM